MDFYSKKSNIVLVSLVFELNALQAGHCLGREEGAEACRAGLGDAQRHQVHVQAGQVCLRRRRHEEIQRYGNVIILSSNSIKENVYLLLSSSRNLLA